VRNSLEVSRQKTANQRKTEKNRTYKTSGKLREAIRFKASIVADCRKLNPLTALMRLQPNVKSDIVLGYATLTQRAGTPEYVV